LHLAHPKLVCFLRGATYGRQVAGLNILLMPSCCIHEFWKGGWKGEKGVTLRDYISYVILPQLKIGQRLMKNYQNTYFDPEFQNNEIITKSQPTA